MATQNSQFPERDRDLITYAQFDGIRNDIASERFELADLEAANNIDLDETGRIARRAGYTSALAVPAHSLWADDLQDVCLFVSGGVLNRLRTDMTSVSVTTLLDALSPVSYTRVNDRVYFANGADTGVYENGAARPWGLPAAPLPDAAVAAGIMPAGTYQYAMTWLRADGQESGCGQAGRVDLATAGGIQFTVPAAPRADVVAAILYLSAANSDVLLEATHAAPGTSLMWAADPAQLSEPIATQFMGPPPAGHLIAHYRGHMFVAAGDTVFVSQPFGYELFDLRDYFQLDGRVTLMAPLVDKDRTDDGRDSGFFIGTDRSMGVLAGSNPREFQYVPKVNYGAIAGSTSFADGTVIKDGAQGARMLPMWMSTQGMCIGMPDLQIINLTRSRFNFTAGGRGASVFMPNPNRFIATANL